MAIWSAEIKELERLYESFKGQLPDLEEELEQLIRTEDANVVMLYSRRCLEVIITDLCECELKRPRQTEPLKGIIDKLHKEGKVPPNIISSMHGLNELSTYGTHPKDFDPEQVKPVLNNLDIILKWYLKYKETGTEIKTKPVKEIKQDVKSTAVAKKGIVIPKKRLIGLISGLMLLAVIVVAVLFLFNIIGIGRQTKELEKSIAVLPFKSLSNDPEKQYLADGMMDAILLHLSKIRDLRVMSRTSVEQYRNPTKTTTAIGRELGVEYLLEGSFQKFGDNVRLIVQLIKTGKEGHVWANDYDRNWNNVFSVQSEVAQAIAKELNAAITPEEKQLIEKIPTANLTAYDFYQRGRDEYKRGALQKAEALYKRALEYDPTFAQAYIGLAAVYWDKHYLKEYSSKNFMDSVLIFTKVALSYNDQLDEAYIIRGNYYHEKGPPEQAIKEYNKALKINPNSWRAYSAKADLSDTVLISLKNLHKAASLNHGSELPDILRLICEGYCDAGFAEKAKYYALEVFKLDGDSVKYFTELGYLEHKLANYEKSVEFLERSYKLDTTNIFTLYFLGENCGFAGQMEKSLKYCKEFVTRRKNLLGSEYFVAGAINHRIGYAYWKNGYKKGSEYYFNKQLDECNNQIKSRRPWSQLYFTYYDIAGVYAFRGDKDKAYKNLRIFNQRKVEPLWILSLIKNDPLFNSIRNEPEFQQIVSDTEAKYQAEHERVAKWLEEQGML
jgi:TolB-like protein